MFNSHHWDEIIITIAILVIQKFIVPRLKFRFSVYILPIISLIIGIGFTINSQSSLLTKALMVGACLLLSIIILLMGESAGSDRRKSLQQKYTKDGFYKKVKQ